MGVVPTIDDARYFEKALIDAGLCDKPERIRAMPVRDTQEGVRRIKKKILDLSDMNTEVDDSSVLLTTLDGTYVGRISIDDINITGSKRQTYLIHLASKFLNTTYARYLLRSYGNNFGLLNEVYVNDKVTLNFLLSFGYKPLSSVNQENGIEEDIGGFTPREMWKLITEGFCIRLEFDIKISSLLGTYFYIKGSEKSSSFLITSLCSTSTAFLASSKLLEYFFLDIS